MDSASYETRPFSWFRQTNVDTCVAVCRLAAHGEHGHRHQNLLFSVTTHHVASCLFLR